MEVTVIIVTLDRSEVLRRCLTCLEGQTVAPLQVVVVDASADDLSKDVVGAFEGVEYLRNENGFGRMTESRNIGLKVARGEVIAFIDDDSFAAPEWLEELVATYADEGIGAVGGRALNNQPNEAEVGVDEIGRLLPNGNITGYFAADPGKTHEVDHMMGCNMSYRREVLAVLGGFCVECNGVSGVREDTDMSFRVRRADYKIVFNPKAVVEHLGAPQAKGKRFDWRYGYYSTRNHLILLIRNYGLFSSYVWRYMLLIGKDSAVGLCKRLVKALGYPAISFWALVNGVIQGVGLRIQSGGDPVRRDADGEAIRDVLKD